VKLDPRPISRLSAPASKLPDEPDEPPLSRLIWTIFASGLRLMNCWIVRGFACEPSVCWAPVLNHLLPAANASVS
jgi:hypothetical protein